MPINEQLIALLFVSQGVFEAVDPGKTGMLRV